MGVMFILTRNKYSPSGSCGSVDMISVETYVPLGDTTYSDGDMLTFRYRGMGISSSEFTDFSFTGTIRCVTSP